MMSPFISFDELAMRQRADSIKILDGSWRMPGDGAAIDDFRERHIAGAQFFDIDQISDLTSPLPHMLPSPDNFARAVGELGISNEDSVAVYDDAGLFSAARVWWMFRVMGHDRISVLNGGLPGWIAAGHAVTDNLTEPEPRSFRATLQPHLLASHRDIFNARERDRAIVDARPEGRFKGMVEEPRAGLYKGAMPGALNLPHGDLLTDDGKMKPIEEIERIFANVGLSAHQPIITTCGSGITAAVLALALEVIGHRAWAVYDGSWAEWGRSVNDPNLFPVIAGEH